MCLAYSDSFFITSDITSELKTFFSKKVQLKSMRCIESIFGYNNKQGIVVCTFTRTEPVQFFCCGAWWKDKADSNNPRNEDDPSMGGSHDVVSSVSPAELRRAVNTVFIRRNACLQADADHFQSSV
jgi:hypothetical protein